MIFILQYKWNKRTNKDIIAVEKRRKIEARKIARISTSSQCIALTESDCVVTLTLVPINMHCFVEVSEAQNH